MSESLDKLTRLAEKHWPDDKWDMLYQYSMKAFDFEVQRFHKLDEKTMKFVTAISLVITVFLAVFKWVVDESEVEFSQSIYVTSFMVFLSLCGAWACFFKSLRLAMSPSLDLNDKILDLFKSNNIASVRISIFKGCQSAISGRRDTIAKKTKFLNYGYNLTSLSALLLFMLIIFVFFETALVDKVELEPQTQKETIMCTEQTNNSEPQQPIADDEPNFDIEPSAVHWSMESADPDPSTDDLQDVESDD
ncbi:hypothetical protein CIF45_RS22195 [Vibrio parahaemolyticus]|nr:hypothetical protein [Vibrio parahaemolyticus]